MTQETLANRTKMKRTDVNRIANGKLLVGQTRLQRIAEALDVSVLELAPAAEPDPKGLLILDRLEAVEAALNRLGPELAKLGRRVRALEQRDQPKTQPKDRRS